MVRLNPRLDINLKKIRENTKIIVSDCKKYGIQVAGVTKGVGGMPEVAKAMVSEGVSYIADSRLENIESMKNQGINAPMMLLRSPQRHELDKTIDLIDVSLQSEMRTINKINKIASQKGKKHSIMLMIEVGDLREGILFRNWRSYCRKIKNMQNVKLEGIGANFACASGVNPTSEKMHEFCNLVEKIEKYLGRGLEIISGGSSVNLHLMYDGKLPKRVNQLRIGESILLGTDMLGGSHQNKLNQDTIKLYGEIIELKQKKSKPKDGHDKKYHKKIKKNSIIERAIIALGRQDAMIKNLEPIDKSIDVLTSSSDHTILDVTGSGYDVWDEIEFKIDYNNLVNLMTSEYVHKKIVK